MKRTGTGEDSLRREHRRFHATRRLAERYGLTLTRDQYSLLVRLIAHKDARGDLNRMRLIKRHVDAWEKSVWWVNLDFLGASWVVAVFDDANRDIVTFLSTNPEDRPKRRKKRAALAQWTSPKAFREERASER